MSNARRRPPWGLPSRAATERTIIGAVVGIVTALIALAVAQLVAALISSPIGAPVDAVGALSIDHAPAAVKDFAINEFGSNDKTVLVWGIRVVLILFAIAIGIVAVRKLWLGMAGLAIFAGIGLVAALTRPTAKATDALPTLIGAGVAAFAMSYLADLARGRPAARWRPRSRLANSGGRPVPASSTAEPVPASSAAAAASAAAADEDLQPDRRRFLTIGAVAAGISVLTYAGGSWLGNTRDVNAVQQALKLPRPSQPVPPLPPGTDFKIPGLSSFITPNSNFYRVDTAIILPEILPAHWKLRIHGMVKREVVLTFDDLIHRPLVEDYITLCCVSNPVGGPYIGNAKWLGVSLRSLLQEAGIKPGADQLFCTSSDGFTSGTPVQTAMDGRSAMLAVAMNDSALPVEHGFPVRLVIPGLYGYVSACKWIVDIEVTTYSANSAYWAQRGWFAQAPVKTESRIDIPGQNSIKAGKPTPIAGVAWAQHKGIEAVEVRLAKGPWHEARLAAVPGIDTWRQWVYDWDVNVRPGNYMIEARATDKTGYTQTSVQVPPAPNGATGYPTSFVNVVS
ncbi:MAG TPA: molybdopterin-dependent oxidoreductase [Streptosporangiaceae bacterium]|nr:molybdopterin-dependent oxidoreductase [Streptosporangiaceae bacterium]